MPRVVFTKNPERHLPCLPLIVGGDSVRAALEAAFSNNPALRNYILDDQGHLRKHVTIAVNGRLVH